MKFIRATLYALIAAGLAACAVPALPLDEERAKPSPAVGDKAAPQGETVVLRHKVRLEIPGRDIPPFDGIMRINRADKTLRVLGLGGMGLTLFDISVTPTDARAVHLIPRLAGVPGLVENIALCARKILPEAGGEGVGGYAGEGWSVSRSGERPWPREVVFRNEKPQYTVRVRLLGISEDGKGKREIGGPVPGVPSGYPGK
ncbi:MAG: hypothetical protein LBS65_03920 [Desulfovibrio sp.]|jgi:hypothetical protein|nr:hypothetical protein [Desulfovibrio sp.]